jgi:hypothetical protein
LKPPYLQPVPPLAPPSGRTIFGVQRNVDVTSDIGGATINGRSPLWLGPSVNGLPLAYAQAQSTLLQETGQPTTIAALDLCYGTAAPAPITGKGPDALRTCQIASPHVAVQESALPTPLFRWPMPAPELPEGQLLIDESGVAGLTIIDGIYIHITGDTDRRRRECSAVSSCSGVNSMTIERPSTGGCWCEAKALGRETTFSIGCCCWSARPRRRERFGLGWLAG